MKAYKPLLYIFLFTCLWVLPTQAQVADTLQADNQVDTGEIVEAGESIIKIEVEKPQVQLFSQRIKPEFDEVNLEKSFIREIIDEGQKIKFEALLKKDDDRIDINKLLTRNR